MLHSARVLLQRSAVYIISGCGAGDALNLLTTTSIGSTRTLDVVLRGACRFQSEFRWQHKRWNLRHLVYGIDEMAWCWQR